MYNTSKKASEHLRAAQFRELTKYYDSKIGSGRL
jgi:hypothetical protein